MCQYKRQRHKFKQHAPTPEAQLSGQGGFENDTAINVLHSRLLLNLIMLNTLPHLYRYRSLYAPSVTFRPDKTVCYDVWMGP